MMNQELGRATAPTSPASPAVKDEDIHSLISNASTSLLHSISVICRMRARPSEWCPRSKLRRRFWMMATTDAIYGEWFDNLTSNSCTLFDHGRGSLAVFLLLMLSSSLTWH